MEHQDIIFSNNVGKELDCMLSMHDGKVYVICDDNTKEKVVPVISGVSPYISGAHIISVLPGDENKNFESLVKIWNELQSSGADRHSIIVNIGGGMVTDMGGFAASTFKRGLRFINVPTTLLAAVDAAVGGKTGINLNGFKNEVGVFKEADAVIISTCFLDTLPIEEVKSGYAEMLKHGLLESEESLEKLLDYDISSLDVDKLLDLLCESVNVKRRVVLEDPFEKGLRKALNLGHTVGHAFESMALERKNPIPHGYAVAWGCVVELVLSHMLLGFPVVRLRRIASFVRSNYGVPAIECRDYPKLLEYMRHDKKNSHGKINFTLLSAPGDVYINQCPDGNDIQTALDLFRDLMGI